MKKSWYKRNRVLHAKVEVKCKRCGTTIHIPNAQVTKDSTGGYQLMPGQELPTICRKCKKAEVPKNAS